MNSPPSESEAKARSGFLARMRQGLGRSTSKLVDGIGGLLIKRKLDAETLEGLEELLIGADLGPATAARLATVVGQTRFGPDVSERDVREILAREIAAILSPVATPLAVDPSRKPYVVLVVGVNGTGKTTTIGKLAKLYKEQGFNVMLAAGDTFRAAAIEQLKIWGARTGCRVVAAEPGADAPALAFDALAEAQRDKADLLLIDTAGRLHNKADLMAELQKMTRVLMKLDAEAPHSVILVLDATTGQNAHAQVEAFRELTNVSGLVLTKLDGTARGGVLVALAERFHLPVHALGIGEGADDLRPFDAQAFARALLGLDA